MPKDNKRPTTAKTMDLTEKQYAENYGRKKTYDDFRNLGQIGRNEDILKQRRTSQGADVVGKLLKPAQAEAKKLRDWKKL